MQIASYIQDLLYRYECVILPGFGAFLTQYQSATYDAKSATWLPPGKTIAFNKQLQTNDGLLANYVASVVGCTYEVALQELRSYAGSLSTALRNEKQVSINKIGQFIALETGHIQFEPAFGANFSTTSFGFETVSGPVIKREQIVSTIEESPILFTPHSRSRVPYLKYAAVGIIALLLAGTGGLQWRDYHITSHNDAEKQKAQQRVVNQIQEATFEIPSPLPPVTIFVPKEKGRYHIVAGAFRVKENAQVKQQQLIEKGFDAKQIGANAYGLHQVVYASFTDRKEALRNLKKIQQTENKAAWLLVKKLD